MRNVAIQAYFVVKIKEGSIQFNYTNERCILQTEPKIEKKEKK